MSTNSSFDETFLPIGTVAFDAIYFKAEYTITRVKNILLKFKNSENCFIQKLGLDKHLNKADLKRTFKCVVLMMYAALKGNLVELDFHLLDEPPFI